MNDQLSSVYDSSSEVTTSSTVDNSADYIEGIYVNSSYILIFLVVFLAIFIAWLIGRFLSNILKP
jgi:hypothetical protein